MAGHEELRCPNLDPFDPRQYIADPHLRRRAPDFFNEVEWSAFHDEPLEPEVKYFVNYSADVEAHSDAYLLYLVLNRYNARIPERALGRGAWLMDEEFHFFGSYAILKASDPDMPPPDVWRAQRIDTYDKGGWAKRPVYSMMFNNIMPAQAAAGTGNVSGSISEDVTRNGYVMISDLSGHKALKTLFTNFARQEGVHGAGYAAHAKEDLEDQPLYQWLARKYIERFTTVVGSGLRPPSDVTTLLRILEQHPEFNDKIAKIDHRASQLPGMAGLTVMQQCVEKTLAA